MVYSLDEGSRSVEIDFGRGGTSGVVPSKEVIERIELSDRRDLFRRILSFCDWLRLCPSVFPDSFLSLADSVMAEGNASPLDAAVGKLCFGCKDLFSGGGDREGAIHD